MNEIEIKQALDTLSDWQARRDLMESDKRALLEDVTVPAEVEAIVKANMRRMSEVESQFTPYLNDLKKNMAED